MKNRFVALLSLGHMVTDINQGAVPAMLPFLIAEHHLSYTAAAGIVFATSIASSVIQPLFGHLADRLSKPWLMILGLLLAGSGLALTGVLPSYRWIVLAAIVSGIGIAAYHPEGARLVNRVAGERKATAMSMFGVGGTLGFAIGPLITTAAILHWGLKGTLVLIVPVGLMAAILATQMRNLSDHGRISKHGGTGASEGPLRDAWAPFARLGVTAVGRSMLFYGLNTFIPLYWIRVLQQSEAAGGIALAVLATAGVIGNLLGGRMADRFGYPKVILAGFCVLIPLLPALLWAKDSLLALAALVPIGLALSATYSPMVVMGQKYLPNHIGLSSGVTLGIAVAIGGVAAPLLGRIADEHGLWSALAAMMLFPVVSAGLALTLPDPRKLAIRQSLGE